MLRAFTAILLCTIFLAPSCTHDPVFTAIEGPSNLIYSPDSLSIETGNSASSAVPNLSGSRPFTFNISTFPSSGGNITIDKNGTIIANSQLASGKYSMSVVVINAAGSVNFTDIYEVRAYDSPKPPAQLVYTPSTVNVLAGTSFTSSSPSMQGTPPFTFALVNNPAPGKISINNQGIVATTTALGPGSYALDIQVTNSVSSQPFNSALTINVSNTAVPPSDLAYSTNAMTINSGATGTSVTPTLSGTSPFTFSLSSSPDAGPSIAIDNNGVITTKSTLSAGTYTLSVKVTNSAGSVDFPDVYTVTANAIKAVTFANDVKPLITQYCSTCHTTGPQTIYTNYSNASRDINLILDRVQRKQGSAGYMPKNENPLTTTQVQILKDWLAQGLPQ
jgi:hypothetical protein